MQCNVELVRGLHGCVYVSGQSVAAAAGWLSGRRSACYVPKDDLRGGGVSLLCREGQLCTDEFGDSLGVCNHRLQCFSNLPATKLYRTVVVPTLHHCTYPLVLDQCTY